MYIDVIIIIIIIINENSIATFKDAQMSNGNNL